ncbi:hypothetical protein [uncultured Chitinophaga sp.]|jgi:hypothetical protein|uniref:baeRF7 domain-containing protein n=1 Tax=uncultured Chitinophaga sp. TaxID=339340 RepID=UPI00261C5FB7|nr:hypothetical protein [uncultured Chitinophaga sp.]
MGKDREGTFHPKKGKPSGSGRESKLGLRDNMDPAALERDEEITEKYTSGEDELAPNVHMRHVNRNTAKGDEEEHLANSLREEPDVLSRKRYNAPDKPAETRQAEPVNQRLTREDFRALATHRADNCITLYMPAHKYGVEVNERQDPILFKHLLQQAQQQLLQKGVPREQVEPLLAAGFDMQRDDAFWRKQQKGLGVFIAQDYFKYIQLPYSVDQQCYVNHSFYTSPLLPLLTSREHFYLLVISKRKATLYEADAFGMQEVPIEGMPRGIDDVVHFEEKDGQQLFRTGSSGAGQGANYHGTGSGRPDDKANISMYMDEVDETLWKELLSTQHVPLMLAAVEYMIPIFRKRTNYRHVVDDALTGNFEHENINALYEKAREKMKPYFEEERRQALEQYGNNSGNGLTSTMPDDIIPACYYSRVDTLFIRKDAQLWGNFNEQDNKLVLHSSQQAGDECMINAAAAKAIETGAAVFMLDKSQMPAGSVMAARMRY